MPAFVCIRERLACGGKRRAECPDNGIQYVKSLL